ncbi:right-handed parallel beta-helix repeat-containing protein [Candidatus Thorarchaeota archaeon]|nr:MAG: right-handed parallel beta-helix repeat-containing protein [Candidatus Thorarchaeota archaeon]
MQLRVKAKITQLIAIGLFVFLVGTPAVVPSTQGLDRKGGFIDAYTPHEAILIDGNAELAAQAAAEEWPGNGTEAAPYLISGYYFYDITHSLEMNNVDLHWAFVGNEVDGPGDQNVWCGIEVDNSSNGIISENIFHGKFRGVDIIDVLNIVIANNTIEDNLLHGIGSEGFINGCVISDNTIRRCAGAGVWSPSAFDSEISRNTITDCNGGGIQILAAAVRCQIIDNVVDGFSGIGIQIGASTDVDIVHNRVANGSGRGLYVTAAADIDIYNNTILNCSDYGMDLREFCDSVVHNNCITVVDGEGIALKSGDHSLVEFNDITSCSGYGIKTYVDAANMTMTCNFLYDNGGSVQAADEGEDNAYVSNYYNDWTAPDANSDGFVDLSYELDGEASNEDLYALADPSFVPTIPEETSSPGTGTGERITPVPLEIIVVAAGTAVALLAGAFILKRRG